MFKWIGRLRRIEDKLDQILAHRAQAEAAAPAPIKPGVRLLTPDHEESIAMQAERQP